MGGSFEFPLRPKTGDDVTFKRIAKGASFQDHVAAAKRAQEADIELSTIFLLGAGGSERSQAHAQGSAKLITNMNPEFVSLLTLTVIPGTPIAKLQARGKFKLPTVEEMLMELRTIVALAEPTNTVFRTNHASNYLPLSGQLPRDRDRIVAVVDHFHSFKLKFIAQRFCFHDQSHFTRHFRRITGTTPAAYRKRFRKSGE